MTNWQILRVFSGSKGGRDAGPPSGRRRDIFSIFKTISRIIPISQWSREIVAGLKQFPVTLKYSAMELRDRGGKKFFYDVPY
jgi:hypothetical protein